MKKLYEIDELNEVEQKKAHNDYLKFLSITKNDYPFEDFIVESRENWWTYEK